MTEKRNIFLVGPVGAGKSTIGKHLADMLLLDFYDSDNEIEKRTGANISWVFDVEGEEGFRRREEAVINDLCEKQGIVLATGGGSIESREVRKKLCSRGIVVYLSATIEKQYLRTQKDKRRPLLQVDNPKQVLEELSAVRDPYYKEVSDFIIHTDEQSAKIVANKIIENLSF